jgi:rsbT antagonist protein RsbS
MEHIPILKMGSFLLVSIQVDLYDSLALKLQSDLVRMIHETQAKGILIDISSLTVVDSFIGKTLRDIAATGAVMDSPTVIVGMQPAVAITLVGLGLPLSGILTALTIEKGAQLLYAKNGPRKTEAATLQD